MQSMLTRRQRVGSGAGLGGAEEVARADLFQPGVQLLQVVLILFQRREGQVACGGLLRNLCQEVATLHLKLPVFLVTVRTEAFDDLGSLVCIERRRHHQDAAAALLLRLAQDVAEEIARAPGSVATPRRPAEAPAPAARIRRHTKRASWTAMRATVG